jgi:hypothetical protein
MDTLCVPVKENDLELRKKTIDDMASIYVGADNVLVLDQGLMAMSGKYNRECNIIGSAWMCRSWTLQEGILSPNCIVQFADGFMIANRDFLPWKPEYESCRSRNDEAAVTATDDIEIQNSGVGQESENITEKLRLHLSYKLFRLKVDHWDHERRYKWYVKEEYLAIQLVTVFLGVWNSLAGRSTTKAEDIYMILSNVLDYEHESLRTYTPEERIQRIILSLGHLPICLFFHVDPADAVHRSRHNRWLPSNLGKCILTSGAIMKVERSTLAIGYRTSRITYLRPDEVPSTNYYFVPDLISPSTKCFSINHQDCTYIFETHYNDKDTFDMSSPDLKATFLIIEQGPPRDGGYRNAAIFYALSEVTVDGYQSHYTLVFHRSAHYRTVVFDPNLPQPDMFLVQNPLYASKVSQDTTLEIKYGMCLVSRIFTLTSGIES